ncbi:hypothetical protein IV76_GL002606 [Carnobacterium maltaromaticum]|nr:hypothetical protein IV76_GL002606 [Carnobacterium maltaromaticum]
MKNNLPFTYWWFSYGKVTFYNRNSLTSSSITILRLFASLLAISMDILKLEINIFNDFSSSTLSISSFNSLIIFTISLLLMLNLINSLLLKLAISISLRQVMLYSNTRLFVSDSLLNSSKVPCLLLFSILIRVLSIILKVSVNK